MEYNYTYTDALVLSSNDILSCLEPRNLIALSQDYPLVVLPSVFMENPKQEAWLHP